MFRASHIYVPRPYVDPINSLAEALSVASLACERPVHNSTIVLWLSSLRAGIGISLYDSVSHEVVHRIVGHASELPEVSSVVLVSMRNCSPTQPGDRSLLQFMKTVFGNSGISLHDWVVVGSGGLYCPRSLLNQPDPWPCSALSL